LLPFNPRHTALPDEEVQWLVGRIVARSGVEPFVRRMVALIDDLKVGDGRRLARVAAHRRDPESKTLHQSSLDYLRELLGYLDRFRKKTTPSE
jgi:hypothetical protein